MNTKQVQLTDKFSGEITTGTVNEISLLLKISRVTLYSLLKKRENDKYLFSMVGEPDNENHKSLNTNESNVKQDSSVKSNSAYIQSQIEDTRVMQSEVRERTILPKGKCVLCSREVYHTKRIEGEIVFICFARCEDAPKAVEPKKPSAETIARLRAYIKEMSQ